MNEASNSPDMKPSDFEMRDHRRARLKSISCTKWSLQIERIDNLLKSGYLTVVNIDLRQRADACQ